MAGHADNPNVLIVEGHDDLQCVASLLGCHIEWPQEKKKSPVWIQIGKSADEILDDGYLSTFLKSPPIKRLGVMLDADANPAGRYRSLRSRCLPFFSSIPVELPTDGLVVENSEQKRFGAWIMPDNNAKGNLEMFLKYLIPDPASDAWAHAVKSVEHARKIGCGCKEAHLSKANLYTWLAWQDPPGQSPGIALAKHVLDPMSPSAKYFVKWFKTLYLL